MAREQNIGGLNSKYVPKTKERVKPKNIAQEKRDRMMDYSTKQQRYKRVPLIMPKNEKIDPEDVGKNPELRGTSEFGRLVRYQ